MIETVKNHLQTLKKKKISIDDLQHFFTQHHSPYETLIDCVQQLETEGILKMVKAHGVSPRPPHLANTYHIQQAALKESYFLQLLHYRQELHPLIQLDDYFSSEKHVIEQDLPYLRKIHQYLQNGHLPTYAVPAPERSFELVGDEKWIEEKGGADCLKRIQLWESMQIMSVADPLMFAVNGKNIQNKHHIHLIVENKTTYQGLLPALKGSVLTTLIYGSGWKIDKGMDAFHEQLLVDGTHTFYYFGDVDRAGISIWYKLFQQFGAIPARVFYDECFTQKPSPGKETQQLIADALPNFLTFFPDETEKLLIDMLEGNHYLPQEVLKTKQLQRILGAWCDVGL